MPNVYIYIVDETETYWNHLDKKAAQLWVITNREASPVVGGVKVDGLPIPNQKVTTVWHPSFLPPQKVGNKIHMHNKNHQIQYPSD